MSFVFPLLCNVFVYFNIFWLLSVSMSSEDVPRQGRPESCINEEIKDYLTQNPDESTISFIKNLKKWIL